MSRTPLIAGNWKMNGLTREGLALAKAIAAGSGQLPGVDLVICPPATLLAVVRPALTGSRVALGAQDCHAAPSGAHTGDIAAPMLAELGCRWVLVGHSERRHVFRETDEEINRKVGAALRHGMRPILCVGETDEERRQGLTFTVVEGQLRAGWAGLSPEDLARCVLAYEPVWAIGTGNIATAAQAAEVHGYLRGLVSEVASKELAQSMRILYGGSVKPDNAQALTQEPDIDGVLVGGASLQAPGFITIAKKSAARSGASKE